MSVRSYSSYIFFAFDLTCSLTSCQLVTLRLVTLFWLLVPQVNRLLHQQVNISYTLTQMPEYTTWFPHT